MTTTTINTVEAKEQFSELLNRVSQNKERIVLVRRGNNIAALIPIEDLALLEATQSKSDLHEAVDALDEARNTGTISLNELKQKVGDSRDDTL